MTILRARETRHFLYLFVRCTCGCRFGHRADRRVLVCYVCGRVADLGRVRTKDQARRKVIADRRRRLRAARANGLGRGNGHATANGHGNGHARPVGLGNGNAGGSVRATVPRRASTRRTV
jgi:hypothetical protein